ncbi:hypothetical protein [Pseudonocardia acidicola]|uniref:HNH endonuclease n=1 Tax=Pseudonocardia acidicola TaxID=2724939 RepID=A0ABX1SBZ6_9PSEU|nr:hypothetical protein [Pseudonocardia acidicola]NMH98387.1 hypothetical protein [Pseudonocardia acidicola]
MRTADRGVPAVVVACWPVVVAVLVAVAGCSSPGGPAGPSAAVPRSETTAAPLPGGCVIARGRADKRCTPGAVNPAVTRATIRSTICRAGWTKTVRPPPSYTDGLKDRQKPEYGEADVPDAQLEEDHLVPLELGGAPRDPANLWPEPRTGTNAAAVKDMEETRLNGEVCSGALSLDAARQQIVADWTH